VELELSCGLAEDVTFKVMALEASTLPSGSVATARRLCAPVPREAVENPLAIPAF